MRINWARVILGGILAGVVINVSEFILNGIVLKANWEEALKAAGKTMEPGPMTLPVWIGWSLLLGIAVVWLYAAIRPRYGAGPGTALRAGIAAWVFVHLTAGIANANLGLLPRRMIAVSVAWTFGELVVAALVGGWAYREPGEVTIR
jgi:hypothetical protein